jgi:hypothetical protein
LVSFRGFFEDYIFAWWNLRLVTELWYVEGFWFLLEGFLKIIFLHGEVLEFPWFFFCLKILLNVDGKATVWHTPYCFLCDINCRRWASVFGFLVCEPFDSKWSFSRLQHFVWRLLYYLLKRSMKFPLDYFRLQGHWRSTHHSSANLQFAWIIVRFSGFLLCTPRWMDSENLTLSPPSPIMHFAKQIAYLCNNR